MTCIHVKVQNKMRFTASRSRVYVLKTKNTDNVEGYITNLTLVSQSATFLRFDSLGNFVGTYRLNWSRFSKQFSLYAEYERSYGIGKNNKIFKKAVLVKPDNVSASSEPHPYIVWCPDSNLPPTTIFASESQAKAVAIKMSEQYVSTFFWAKLCGKAEAVEDSDKYVEVKALPL